MFALFIFFLTIRVKVVLIRLITVINKFEIFWELKATNAPNIFRLPTSFINRKTELLYDPNTAGCKCTWLAKTFGWRYHLTNSNNKFKINFFVSESSFCYGPYVDHATLVFFIAELVEDDILAKPLQSSPHFVDRTVILGLLDTQRYAGSL